MGQSTMKERSMRMMIATVCTALALGAAACEKKQSNTNTGGATNTSSSNSGSTDAPKPKSDSAPVRAMESFIEAMGEARFADALKFVDPNSVLYEKMGQTVSNLGKNEQADQLIASSFSGPYKRAEASLVTEEADRAMVQLERAGFPPADVTMVKGDDGVWRVNAGDELFAPAVGGGKPGSGGGEG